MCTLKQNDENLTRCEKCQLSKQCNLNNALEYFFSANDPVQLKQALWDWLVNAIDSDFYQGTKSQDLVLLYKQLEELSEKLYEFHIAS